MKMCIHLTELPFPLKASAQMKSYPSNQNSLSGFDFTNVHWYASEGIAYCLRKFTYGKSHNMF